MRLTSFCRSVIRTSLSGFLIALTLTPPAAAQGLARADGQTTPVKRYGPAAGCGPAMIVSHGFGGDENGNAGLAATMAAQGWRVLVMGHRESGRAAFRSAMVSGQPREAMRQVARDPEAHRLRFLDLDAAFADMTRACRPSSLVLAGHSMGAMTTILEAGATATFGRYGKNRFDAYVALSPQGIGSGFTEGSWSGISKPVLMITGTRDEAFEGGPESRLSAFAGLPPGRKRLAVIAGAGHLQLAANGGNDVSAVVSKLVPEFLSGLSQSRSLPAARHPGVEIRDK